MHFSYLIFINSTFFISEFLNLSSYNLIFFVTSYISGTANSAAADGVGALKSATKSDIVKSVSCPTAEIIGISDSYMLSATTFSLNGHKSSKEPPPLANINTSANLFLFIYSIP